MRQLAFLLGPGFIPRINALFLGSSPRLIPAIGLVGAPVILASAIGTIFRRLGPLHDPSHGALPIAVWEFSLGVHL